MKIFILKIIAGNEVSIMSFLSRLEYLQEMLKNNKPDYDSQFILSTIHSSKGLEYDQVYLLDVCDGVFPNKVIRSKNATPQEKKTFEEERRLFYVGMTRAKNNLFIFKIQENSSVFIKEMSGSPGNDSKTKRQEQPKQKSPSKMKYKPYNFGGNDFKCDIDLIIGERVVQNKYGSGFVTDVEYDKSGKIKRFTVEFDSGDEREFAFPIAFKLGMSLERDNKPSE